MTRQNPPLNVEIVRGAHVESAHAIDAVLADADGGVVATWGEGERMVYPRSAVKALQALPLIETGAADAFGLEPRHIALACSSHNGEEIHTGGAAEMLALAGLGPACLECGVHHPELPRDIEALARKGEQPSQLHNNCSGKHAGFLAVAAHQGIDVTGYVKIDHPVQQLIARTLQETTGFAHGDSDYAIDGCSIPTYRLPLDKLATVFARFGICSAQDKARSSAMKRLQQACFAHPEMVAGTNRACTTIMRALKNRAFVKVGAEGVYIASLPELGFGVALKARDGARRAAETAIAGLITSLLPMNEVEIDKINALAVNELNNRRGLKTGYVKFVDSRR